MYEKDLAHVRELASRVAEIAALPVQQETIGLWKALNDLHPVRPMVHIDGIPWHELNVNDELTLRTQDPFLRGVENMLRRILFQWNHFRVDMVVDPVIAMPRVIRMDGFGITMDERTEAIDPANDVVAHEFHDQCKTDEDLEKIHTPTVELDVEMTRMVEQRSHEIFDGIMPFRMQGWLPEAQQWVALAAEPGTNPLVTGMYPDGAGNIAFGVWDLIVYWRGAQNVLFDLGDRPEFVHRLMAKLTQAHLEMLDQLEEKGLIGHHQSKIRSTGAYTDQLPAEGFDENHVRPKDVWTSAMAQILTSVSPAMFKEFEVDYTSQWCKRFGLVYFGCCEALDRKMEYVRMVPNVRKVSITQLADVERAAAEIGGDFVFSRKPNPAFIAADSWHPDVVEADLRDTLDRTRAHGCPVELIFKGVSTVRGKPERLWEWADIAMRLATA
jgi:hypothetical protein